MTVQWEECMHVGQPLPRGLPLTFVIVAGHLQAAEEQRLSGALVDLDAPMP